MKTYTLKRTRQRADPAFANDLNAQQRAVVLAGSGPMLVIAGAGSGKTRTLTYRVAHLLNSGVRPAHILLLTFTNKAAKEMLRRVGGLVGETAGAIWGGTFHHIAHRILRQHAERLDFPKRFGIMDTEDSRSLLDVCVTEARNTTAATRRRFPKANVLRRIHSLAINTQHTVPQIIATHYPYFERHLDAITRILVHYTRRKHEMGLMDFDDLLIQWRRLFAEHPAIAARYTERFEHVLVDEYQDTNPLQSTLVDHCAATHRNLMVVGDDCQSIYGFRGADAANILSFPDRHPGCRVFFLEENYRSTPEILALANHSITFNTHRYDKTLRAQRRTGMRPAQVACEDVYQQADFVAQRILDLIDEGIRLDDIAVLYRAHYQSMELQLELTRRDIPFTLRSGLRFFEQAHVKDVLAFLRFVANPRDELSFVRIAKLCDGIGNAIAQRLWQQLTAADDPLRRVVESTVTVRLPGRARRSFQATQTLLTALCDNTLQEHPDAMLTHVLDSPYRDHLLENYNNAEQRLADLEQLTTFARRFLSLTGFLSELALHTTTIGQTLVDDEDVVDDEGAVVLSTIHQAKGLEWPAVFVTSLSDGSFPLHSALKSEQGEEEERRLFYVATTRARDQLYLTFSQTREDRRGFINLQHPSRFLTELTRTTPTPLTETWSLTPE